MSALSGSWRLARDLAQIERRVGGRLGVAVYDADTRRTAGHRIHERFPMCSTFKLLLAAQILHRVDRAQEQLTRVIPYTPSNLLEYAPVTRAHVGEGGMSVSALLQAALEVSDNTAANLLLASVGGPRALTTYLRSIGDPVTRLDRNEPALNGAEPGDPRDTTTPDAMVSDLRQILLGNLLSDTSRDHLLEWLQASTTGTHELHAGLPPDWRMGDKTGSGRRGTTNDVAIIWPTGRSPILVAAFLTDTAAEGPARNVTLAMVGRAIADWVAAGAPR